MPIYEYRCERGHTFETVQRMSDDALEVCEVCDAPAARVLHAPAVHFKGSGFYNTDYGTRKRAREKAAEKKNDGGSGKGDGKSTASDTKPSSDSGSKKADSTASSAA